MARFKIARRIRRAGIGTLPLLAGLLMASGLVRLGDGTGGVLVREFGAIALSAATSTPETAPSNDDEVSVILTALKDREAQLDAREARLVEREAQLDGVEERIRAQMGELEAAETKLSELLKLANQATETDLSRLTTVYETMKPAEAARVFTEMEPAFAAGFLGRMRPESAAQVMAGLDPQTAYTISVMIAGRNAATGSQD
ncbi:MotE family protein [Palleronia sp. LCG004]|uniref:MotE family protein n=1 Tax=Palleronia sp. LCG004 TaxID=3079304 RepID=UPI00294286D7|nr:hypothetical protein [Palleronia sp. LCG004]WOI56180.1 hypothetical protein RVY76_14300 [Palleronia sp. LCG004]